MSIVRLLPAWLHAIADYAVGATLIVVALVAAHSGKAIAAGVVIGAVVLVVSMLTRYPLGIIKVLPFTVHSAGDYLATALLVISPFALGFQHSETSLSVFYIVTGLAVLGVSLITNYQYGLPAQPAVIPTASVPPTSVEVAEAVSGRPPSAPVRRARPLRAPGH